MRCILLCVDWQKGHPYSDLLSNQERHLLGSACHSTTNALLRSHVERIRPSSRLIYSPLILIQLLLVRPIRVAPSCHCQSGNSRAKLLTRERERETRNGRRWRAKLRRWKHEKFAIVSQSSLNIILWLHYHSINVSLSTY